LQFERGVTGDIPWSLNLGPKALRSSRTLKVWFTLREHGTIKLGEKIAENCEQALYLASLLEKYADRTHIVRPVSLNIVKFRFEPDELASESPQIIDGFNNNLMADIQLSGVAAPSTTHIRERLYIRVAIVSHRCTLE
jgi:aromatic-L-amino-acid decarboxylase